MLKKKVIPKREVLQRRGVGEDDRDIGARGRRPPVAGAWLPTYRKHSFPIKTPVDVNLASCLSYLYYLEDYAKRPPDFDSGGRSLAVNVFLEFPCHCPNEINHYKYLCVFMKKNLIAEFRI